MQTQNTTKKTMSICVDVHITADTQYTIEKLYTDPINRTYTLKFRDRQSAYYPQITLFFQHNDLIRLAREIVKSEPYEQD